MDLNLDLDLDVDEESDEEVELERELRRWWRRFGSRESDRSDCLFSGLVLGRGLRDRERVGRRRGSVRAGNPVGTRVAFFLSAASSCVLCFFDLLWEAISQFGIWHWHVAQ